MTKLTPEDGLLFGLANESRFYVKFETGKIRDWSAYCADEQTCPIYNKQSSSEGELELFSIESETEDRRKTGMGSSRVASLSRACGSMFTQYSVLKAWPYPSPTQPSPETPNRTSSASIPSSRR
ncbi:hypothetical protein Ddc_13814 [Ditylenchus destructor]|nr:hypothetical protein Ddc_13814 [Ditylenchus destructor]